MATPVNISTISRTSNVVTITSAAAHGLVVNQLVWVQGVTDTSFNGIYNVATVANSTTLTYAQTAANASSTGGTTQPAKEIIALNLTPNTSGEVDVLVAFWYPITAGNENPLPGGTISAFARAVTDENAAIVAGRMVEELFSTRFPSTYTGAQMEAFLQAMYSAKNGVRSTVPQSGQFYGFFFDGTGWSRA